MGYTNRKFISKEIAILTEEYPDHDTERGCVGDIIVVRHKHGVIGLKEATNLIWLRVDGFEENDYEPLMYSNLDVSWDFKGQEPDIIRFDKRRFCIPLKRLKQLFPSFDIDRAKDTEDAYQPFITMDFSDSGYYYYLAYEKPLSIYGLVYDKTIQDYL